ncbi:MAG: CoA pyrophosphatase, partial [Methylobacterium sp.]
MPHPYPQLVARAVGEHRQGHLEDRVDLGRVRREARLRVDQTDHRRHQEPGAGQVGIEVAQHPHALRRQADLLLGLAIVLTQRAAHLRDHSGQVALPGGKIDPTDASPLAAALREAEEEVGLSPRHVRMLGYLDPYLSGTGFLVAPVIGLVDPEARLAPNPAEVDAIFEVPLAVIADRARYELRMRVWQGRDRRFYALPYG